MNAMTRDKVVSAAQYRAVVDELCESQGDINVLQQRVEYLQKKVVLLESEVARAAAAARD